jgi:septum formation protein
MATWLYNTLFGAAPQTITVGNPSSSVPLLSDTDTRRSEKPSPSGSSSVDKRSSMRPRPPLSLPALDLIRGKRVILASASPRRAQLLSLLSLNPEIIPSSFAEDLDKGNHTPWEYVLETATQKCMDVYKTQIELTNNGVEEPVLVIAADTVICLSTGEVLEKPKNERHHLAMLQTLRDVGPHKVYTAVVCMSPSEGATYPGYHMQSSVEETTVVFDKMVTDELLKSYVLTREGADKAGGYAVQGLGSILIEKIEGCYDNVVGLPLRTTLRLIEKVLNGDEEMEKEEGDEDVQL